MLYFFFSPSKNYVILEEVDVPGKNAFFLHFGLFPVVTMIKNVNIYGRIMHWYLKGTHWWYKIKEGGEGKLALCIFVALYQKHMYTYSHCHKWKPRRNLFKNTPCSIDQYFACLSKTKLRRKNLLSIRKSRSRSISASVLYTGTPVAMASFIHELESEIQ